jgi:iron complex outermembrane recepter protein
MRRFTRAGTRGPIKGNHSNSRSRGLRLWLITAAALPTVAAALDAPASSATETSPTVADARQSTPASPEATVLGDVVVTAQRIRSTESRTPIAMDVISGEQLTKQALVTVADLNGYVQNLNVQENYNGIQFTVRGVTNSNGSTLNDPAVAFMQDGIYIPRQTTPMYLGFYDIDRVEVLRGPQGTLWGRNTTAGVVNIITNSPDLTSLQFAGSASIGNYGATNDELMLNVPVTSNFAVRAAVSYDRRDTYLTKTPGDPYSLNPAKGDLAGRVSALWKINDAITLGVKADYANMDNVFFSWVPYTNFYRLPNTSNPIYNLENPIYYDGGTSEQLSLNGYRQYWQGGTSAHTWGVTPQLDWDLGPLKMTYLGAYRAQDEHYIYEVPLTPSYTMPNIYVSSDEVNSQELRFATQGLGRLQAQFGLYYFREALYDNWSIYDFPNVLHFGYLAVGSDPQVNKSRAAFAQATYSLLPPLRLTAGLRESHDEKSYFSESISNSQPYSVPATNVAIPSFATISESKLTWRAGVEYDLLDHTMLYGTVSTGYKAGGVNSGCLEGTSRNGIVCTGILARPASVLFYRPETLTSYEAGVKSRFAGDTIYVTLDGFHYGYNNLQLVTVQNVSGLEIEATTNAANASVNGVEFNGTWRPDSRNTVALGLTYLDAEYGDYFPLGPGNPPNFKGRPLDDSPKYTANLGYTYTQPLDGAGSLQLSVHSYFSAYYVLSDVAIPVQYRQPAYHITDINATYSFPGNEWYVEAYARNLENKIIVVNVGPTAAVPSAPLTFGLRAGFNY